MLATMAGYQPRNESKLTLEIRTKSIEQTLVPLVTQVKLHLSWTLKLVYSTIA